MHRRAFTVDALLPCHVCTYALAQEIQVRKVPQRARSRSRVPSIRAFTDADRLCGPPVQFDGGTPSTMGSLPPLGLTALNPTAPNTGNCWLTG